MIKVVLIDLDDTLIRGNTHPFFNAYLRLLGEYASHLAPPQAFMQQVMASYLQTVDDSDPTTPLYERFMAHFAANMKLPEDGLVPLFNNFYTQQYPKLQELGLIQPQPEALGLLDWLFNHDYRVVIATNPGLPEAAIRHRMTWGGVDPDAFPFTLITSLETMHFGKSQPEYYAEILVRLDIDPAEAIMVGDDWNNDIAGAAAVGMNTYWITEDGSLPPDAGTPLDGYGSFSSFAQKVQSGWLCTVQPHQLSHQAIIYQLAAYPAVIDVLQRTHPPELLECCPADNEWSVREIVCHLVDHEAEEDRARLERILKEDNPFLSANYDPWAHAHRYKEIPLKKAFEDFAYYRAETVKWLRSLPDEVWQRPARHAIFGPTTFEEMVRFIKAHDRTHLRQMHDAVRYAMQVRGQS